MKVFSFLLLPILIFNNCVSQSKIDLTSTVIGYNVISKGFYQKIKVENQTAWIFKNKKDKPDEIKLNDLEWRKLINEFQKINLESLSALKAPTQRRFYDGAAIGMLTIIKDGKTYESTGFDHGVPPKEIEKIVTLLVTFIQK